MADLILDASAVLANHFGEPGGDQAAEAFATALIGAVNLSEVIAKLIERGRSEPDALKAAMTGGYAIVAFDEALALRAATRRRGLSLGDRACLALAEREGLPVLTADRSWSGLDIGVEIRLIR